MTTDPLTQFELLLEAGKLDEAKALLASVVSRDLSPEEESKAKALLTHLYIKLSNAVNDAYLETLKDSIAKLKDLRKREKAFLETAKLAETRAELAK